MEKKSFLIPYVICYRLSVLFLLLAISSGLYAKDISSQDFLIQTIKNYILENEPNAKDVRWEIKIKKIDQNSKINSLPDNGKLTVAAPVYTRLLGDEIIPIEIYEDNILKQKIFSLVEVKGFKKILVAKENLKKGQIILRQNLELAEKSLEYLPYRALENSQEAVGKEIISPLSKGMVLQEWMLRNIPAMRRSEKVNISAHSGNVTVKREGIVLKDAYEGDTTEAKLIGSGVKVKGVVKNGEIVMEVLE